ncbi:CFI-box-CTERM domain-containing protein [Flagellimonas sp.]|uniref:CFI-box-CTERM domain-containing protein n=1 Tax=Flagellimonas sp. TaxID=2058762 RepID=UPI003B5BB5D2
MKPQLLLFLLVFGIHPVLATEPPKESLGDIIKKVRDMYNRGIERTTIANYITETVDDNIKSTNNEELFEDPLNWFRLLGERNLNTDLKSEAYNDIANVAWTTGLGNCEENSAIVYYILQKAGVKEHVRIVRTERHSFTVWDIHPSARIDKPNTWGDNALVVDPWLGRNITREEVETNRWFMNNDPNAEVVDHTTFSDPEADSWNRINALYNRENNIKPDLERHNNHDEDCFIATAVYGDPNAPNIQKLRVYRDTVLKRNPLGIAFVNTYETVGPVFAFFIRNDEERKKWVQKNIIEYAVRIASEHQ